MRRAGSSPRGTTMSSERKNNIRLTRDRLKEAVEEHETLKAEYERCAAAKKKRPAAIETIRLCELVLEVAKMLAEARDWGRVNWTLDKLHRVKHFTP